MTRRDAVVSSLNHQAPDRVPVDFGSTAITGMHCSCVAGLREYFGLERRPVKVHEPYQMLGLIEGDLLDALGIDVIGVPARETSLASGTTDGNHGGRLGTRTCWSAMTST